MKLIRTSLLLAVGLGVIGLALVPTPQVEAEVGGGLTWSMYWPGNPYGCSGPPHDCVIVIVTPDE